MFHPFVRCGSNMTQTSTNPSKRPALHKSDMHVVSTASLEIQDKLCNQRSPISSRQLALRGELPIPASCQPTTNNQLPIATNNKSALRELCVATFGLAPPGLCQAQAGPGRKRRGRRSGGQHAHRRDNPYGEGQANAKAGGAQPKGHASHERP